MSTLYIAGEKGNLLSRGTVGVTDAAAQYPASYLYDGHPGRPLIWSANGADKAVTLDAQLLTNGDFETSTLSGWTESVTGTGATAESAAGGVGGSKACELDAGAAGTAIRLQEVTVRAGERLKITAQCNPPSGTGSILLYNPTTGNYYSSGAWSTTVAAADTTVGTGSYEELSVTFTMESISACGGQPLTTLRVLLFTATDAAVLFDDVLLVPAVNFCSVHGHNLRPIVVPEFRSSTDNFSASDTLEATLTIARPSFYGYLAAAVYRRYWRLLLSGTNTATPYLGEVWIGYAAELTDGPEWGYTSPHDWPQVRNATQVGQQHVSPLAAEPSRRIEGNLRQLSDDSAEEFLLDLWWRTLAGAQPVVLVPRSESDVVMHGRFERLVNPRATQYAITDTPLVFAEDGFPVVGV